MIDGESHLSAAHPVAVAAARLCAKHLGSQGTGRIGRVACGACWEKAIRADERVAVLFDLPPVPPEPEPRLVDEIAVELAAAGQPVSLNRVERLAAVSLLLSRGLGVTAISRRLRLNGTTAAALIAQVRQAAGSVGRAA